MGTANDARIEDIGSKLGGTTGARPRKAAKPRPAKLPKGPPLLPTIWPEPDFRSDVLEGRVTSRQAALFMAIYRALPPRPFNDMATELRNPGSVDDYRAGIDFFQTRYTESDIETLDDLAEAWLRACIEYSERVGRPNAFYATGRRAGGRGVRNPLDIGWMRQFQAEFLPEFGWPYDPLIREDDAFGVVKLRRPVQVPDAWTIARAHGRGCELLSEESWPTREEALSAAIEYVRSHIAHRAESETPSPRVRGIRPTLTCEPTREGPSWRTEAVTPTEFARRFRFRGVEFGSSLSQIERQAVLNSMFDALMDLTDMCDLPPAFASLGGKLGMAFGSRGRRMFAAAHFDSVHWLIHFTKRGGPGKLAHEFGHAFDYYVGAQLEEGMTLSRLLSKLDGDVYGFGDGALREALSAPGISLRAAIFGGKRETQWTSYFRAAVANDGRKEKRYWSRPEELFARAFETWVYDMLSARGRTNEFLVQSLADGANWGLAHAPYPSSHERVAISSSMGDFMKAAADYWKERRAATRDS